MSRAGGAYATPDTISYAYNDRSELTGAASNVDAAYSYSYAYDPIGNRTAASEAGVPWTYTTNNLNQYTSASENNSNLAFSYDLDGSMTYRPVDATGGWTQVWNCENRMAETYKGADRLTFRYDYMGRRVEKCVYNGETLASRTLFVYDGFKCVQELDGMDGNAVLRTHFWQPPECGLDVILATADASGTACFLHDANKNVMQETDTAGALRGNCQYAPFGNGKNKIIPYSFSSEYHDIETILASYSYRDFDSSFGRWTSFDKIENYNMNNLYCYVNNNPVCNIDQLGLVTTDDCAKMHDICYDDCSRTRRTKCAQRLCYADCAAELAICMTEAIADQTTDFLKKNPEVGIIGVGIVIITITPFLPISPIILLPAL